MRVGVVIIVLDGRGIARLQVTQAGRLDIDEAVGWARGGWLVDRSLASASTVDGHAVDRWMVDRVVEGLIDGSSRKDGDDAGRMRGSCKV